LQGISPGTWSKGVKELVGEGAHPLESTTFWWGCAVSAMRDVQAGYAVVKEGKEPDSAADIFEQAADYGLRSVSSMEAGLLYTQSQCCSYLHICFTKVVLISRFGRYTW